MKNETLARMFRRMADILELRGESAFRVNAYRKASASLLALPEDIESLREQGRLNDIPGIGDALAKKIDEFLGTGRMTKYEELNRSLPEGLLDLLRIRGLGPRTLARLHGELNIGSASDLKRALVDGTLAGLPGMGSKRAEGIRKGLEEAESVSGRIPLGAALPIAEGIIHRLRSHPRTGRIYPAGSVRRMCETVGDIDILVETDHPEEILRAFIESPDANHVLAAGRTRARIVLESGIQVDLHAAGRDTYGAALQYFTGSPAHNVRLRGLAKRAGLKINEYGVFRGSRRICGGTEEEMYDALDLAWIPPELREDRGEIEAARQRSLPELVDIYDVQGDFHIHTDWSDGRAPLEAMAEKAMELGYAYIGICDHSPSASYAGGLTVERLAEQIHAIRALNEKLRSLRILTGSEVDIRTDGTLDLPDEILETLDIVVASVHTGFGHSVTKRMTEAVRNPNVDILAHPTGRLIGQREGYRHDLDAVIEACAETGTAMEINACVDRMDLNDENIRKAKSAGVRFSVGTDAHHPDAMEAMRLGFGTARRAWLEKDDIRNCRTLDVL